MSALDANGGSHRSVSTAIGVEQRNGDSNASDVHPAATASLVNAATNECRGESGSEPTGRSASGSAPGNPAARCSGPQEEEGRAVDLPASGSW